MTNPLTLAQYPEALIETATSISDTLLAQIAVATKRADEIAVNLDRFAEHSDEWFQIRSEVETWSSLARSLSQCLQRFEKETNHDREKHARLTAYSCIDPSKVQAPAALRDLPEQRDHFDPIPGSLSKRGKKNVDDGVPAMSAIVVEQGDCIEISVLGLNASKRVRLDATKREAFGLMSECDDADFDNRILWSWYRSAMVAA